MSVQNIKYVTLDEETDSILSHQANLLATRSVEISTQTESAFTNTPAQGGSMIGAIFILMNAVLGAGVLEFPYMFSKVGLITAFLLLAFLILCAGTSHIVLAKSVDMTDATNYHELVGKICGTKIALTAQLALMLYCVGSNVAYMVTVGDQLTDVCFYVSKTTVDKHEYYCDRHFIVPVASIVLILPLIWIKNISAFSYVSFFSVASVFYLVAAVFVEYLYMDKRADIDLWYPPSNADPISILSILPTISFAYQCHMTSVPLYAELAGRTTNKYLAVVGVAMFLASSAYLIVGYTGFAIYGTEVNPDIILSFPDESIVMTIGRFAVTVAISMTYPIVLFIGREALEGALMELSRNTRYALQPNNEKFRITSIALWFTITTLVATFASGIKEVISIVGSLAALFMFLYPGCIIVVMSWGRRVYAHVFVGACFIALCAVVVLMNIVNTIQENTSGHDPDTLVTWWKFQVPLS